MTVGKRKSRDPVGSSSHLLDSLSPQPWKLSFSPPFLSKALIYGAALMSLLFFFIIWSLLDADRKPLEIFFCLGNVHIYYSTLRNALTAVILTVYLQRLQTNRSTDMYNVRWEKNLPESLSVDRSAELSIEAKRIYINIWIKSIRILNAKTVY
jgi:hypothetical protein